MLDVANAHMVELPVFTPLPMPKKLACLAALLVAATSTLMATPITWTLSGVTFGNGSTASGKFVYDSDTNTFSSININVSNGDQSVQNIPLWGERLHLIS